MFCRSILSSARLFSPPYSVNLLLTVTLVLAPSALAQNRLMAASGVHIDELPLIFEPNKGQAPKGVDFMVQGSCPIFLQSDAVAFVVPATHDGEKSTLFSAVTLRLVNSNKKAPAASVDILPGKSNYFIGRNPANWRSGIPQYAKVAFRSVYPGTDLVYYGNQGQLEYDLILSPGASPSSVKFRVAGTDRVELNSTGDLLLETAHSTLKLHKPAIYQIGVNGARRAIEGGFVVNRNDISFAVGNYDVHSDLVIDPVLSYSTLIGANNSTQVQGVAADANGNMYITGTTFATNYPAVNAFQTGNNGTTNVFVTKLNPTGNTILFSTYIGSGGFDNAAGIAVDGGGNAYVTGTVGASNFPTTPGAFMTTCSSLCNTPFVSKFFADGTLAFSTFMGGSNSPAHAIAVDGEGEAYIAGDSASDDLPTSPGSIEPTYPGLMCTSCYVGYIEKLNASGTALIYSTYFGLAAVNSAPSTAGTGIAVDSSGSAYLVGNSADIPLKSPIQVSPVGAPDAFIAKLSPDGSSLVYSTYLGGDSPFFFNAVGNFPTSVAVDPLGNAHVTGTTSSCDFPLTLNAFSTDCVTTGYDQKIFALALNPTGSQLLFSTFLRSGNSPKMATDASGNSYITGNTTANDFPVLKPIESTSQSASLNSFITELDLTGKFLFSTYLGATGGGSQAAGIAVDPKGGIYVAGSAQGDFPLLNPIPSQILQSTYYTIFAAKVSPSNAHQISLSPRVSPILALRNVSSTPLTIESIVPSSNFTMGGNCGTTLAAGGGCNLILQGAADNKTTGTVTITSNASSAPQQFTIHKLASGDAVGSIISILPPSVQFPAQLIGTQSAAKRVVIQNLGLQPAAINSITMIQPSAFKETNNCPALLNPAASCTISITYHAATAQDSAQLAIINDPNQTRETVFLGGTGSSSAISSSVSAVQFGTQFAGTPGVGRIVNLTNTTPYPATATGISASAGFAQTNNCTSALTSHASCRVSVTFAPTGNQEATGTLSVGSYGPGGTQNINLYGTGFSPGDLTVSPPALSFPLDYLGNKESAIITVTNTSQNTISITSIKASVPFLETNNCPTSLGSTASCQVTVSYQPKQTLPVSGTVQVAFSGSGSPQLVGLTGTAQTIVQFVPGTVQFGAHPVNMSGPATQVFIDNNGTTTVTLSAVSLQGSDYSITSNSCGTALARNTGCILELQFTPSATGVRTGTLSVKPSDSSTPITASLEGTGISNGSGTLSPATLNLGSVTVGATSKAKNITLKNAGTGALTLSGISVSPSFFGQTNTCGPSLVAGASCTISVTFSPILKGMLAGSLAVQDDGAGSPHTITLSGIGQ
jgi:hypothetical protein